MERIKRLEDVFRILTSSSLKAVLRAWRKNVSMKHTARLESVAELIECAMSRAATLEKRRTEPWTRRSSLRRHYTWLLKAG